MKSRHLVIGGAWILTVAAVYLLGSGSRPEAGTSTPSENGPAAVASKSVRSARAGSASKGDAGRPITGSRGVQIATARPPREAVAELAHLADPLARAAGFLALAESLSADQFRDVVDDFRSLGITTERMSEYAILLHAWGKTDPEGALDYALKNTGTNFARHTVLASWAADHPDAALAWANEHAPKDKPNALLIGVIRGIAPHDLARATEILGTLPRSEERGEALRGMLPLILKDGIDSALAWSDTIGESILRQGAVTFIANSISDEDPRQAAGIVLALPDEDFQVRGIYGVASDWARSDPEDAIAWAESLDPKVRASAAGGIVSRIAAADPAQAAAWMESIASTTELDPAIHAFLRTASRKDPELALAWAGELSNEQQRASGYHRVIGDWMRADPAAAGAWLQSNPDIVPEEVRQRFAPQGGQ